MSLSSWFRPRKYAEIDYPWRMAGATCHLIKWGSVLRFSATTAMNLVAWMMIAVLISAAIVITKLLGPAGLILLGGLTALVCARAQLSEANPTWGVEVFKASTAESRASPEERAALLSERQALVAPFRFYARCGMFLMAVGAIMFIWQLWHLGTG